MIFRFQTQDYERQNRARQEHTKGIGRSHQRFSKLKRIPSVRFATQHVRRGQSDHVN